MFIKIQLDFYLSLFIPFLAYIGKQVSLCLQTSKTLM